jgi:RND family efflux transporter MFP subunit
MSAKIQSATSPRRPLGKKKSSPFGWIKWVVLLLLLGAGVGAYFYQQNSAESAEVAVVKRGTALAGVYGTVNVEPVNQVIVRTRHYGQITALKVKEGQSVKAGDLLVEITDDSFQRQLDSSTSALEYAKTRQSMGPSSAAALRNKEIEVEKLKKLLAANNIAPIEYEKATNELTSLRELVKTEQLNLDLEVENLNRGSDSIKSRMAQLQVTAPIDGVVLNLFSHLGEFVPPQSELCRIGSSSNQLVAQINEEDVGYLQPGMKAQIRLYAHQDKALVGTLKEVMPQAENQIYRVVFTLDNPPATLLPGMTGEMNIIINEHKNVLTLPTRAIRKGNQVLLVKDGVVRSTTIKTGFRTLEKTEITEGAEEGDQIILSNHDLYPDGIKVRSTRIKEQ